MKLLHEELQLELDDLVWEKESKLGQKQKMQSFIANLKASVDELRDWNERIWMLLVESVVVHRDSSFTFKFHNG